jgi:hypothetical protein
MAKRLKRDELFPHVVRLPKDALSPTSSIYKHYDIVKQERVLNIFVDAPLVLRSSAPFVVRVRTKRSVRNFNSKDMRG